MSRIADFYAAQEGKAFPYRVELTDAGGPLYSGSAPAAYNDYNGLGSNRTTQTPLSQREAPLHMQTYGGRESIDWLMDAVTFVANSASAADYHFHDGTNPVVIQKDATDPPEIGVAPTDLADLLSKPNPYMNWEDLLDLTLIDWLVVGNAYWVKWQLTSSNRPLALYRMCPEFVKVVPGEFGPTAYRYRLPGTNEDTEFTPDQVVHFKRPNPHSPYYGLGLVKGGARALDMELALTDTMASYYEKQALPSGVVQTERRVPKDVFNKLKTQLRSFYGGGRNAGQLMVLEAGLKFQTVSPTAGEALFSQMGGWSRDRIFAMFNMNKRLLGISDDLGLASGELGEWQLLFDQKTMVPLCKRLSTAISRGLTQPGWSLDIVIDYQETQQPDLVLKRAQTLSAVPGVRVREVREAAGLPPTGDPDIDEFVLNLPGPNMDANGQGGTADRNLAGEPGRPPLAPNVPGFGTPQLKGKVPPPAKTASGQKALEEDTVGPAPVVLPFGHVYGGYRPARRNVPARGLDAILADLDAIANQKAMAPANTHVGEIANVRPPEDLLADTRLSALDGLSLAMHRELKDAATVLERGLLDATEGKAEGTIYQRIKNAKAWAAFKDRLSTILETYASQALSMANVHHASQGLAPSDQDYAERAGEILARPKGIGHIFDTLKSSITAKVLAKQRQSADKSEIDKEIMDAITEWQAGSAATVAITEATHAYNVGTLDILEANGETETLVSDGEDDDQPCIDANGETWPITHAREHTLEHPRCRRAFVRVPAAAVA